jgi:hypothetical protein
MKTTRYLSIGLILSTFVLLCVSNLAFGAYELVKAFAFGADDWTRATYNVPSVQYIKVSQSSGANWTYSAAQGHGYTYTGSLDDSANNRGYYTGDDEIYDQFTGVKKSLGTPPMLFRIDVENAKYRFVAAAGDADNADHSTTIRVRDGDAGNAVVLVDNFQPTADGQFWTTGFEDKVVPPFIGPPLQGAGPVFFPQPESPILEVTQGFIVVEQDNVGTNDSGGDLALIEVWKAVTAGAGPDQKIDAGTKVTLTGTGPDDATSYTWTQTGGQERFTAVLQPSANQKDVWFDTPVVDVGFVLTFKITVISPTEGEVSDEVKIFVYAPNVPKVAPSNLFVFPIDQAGQLSYRVRWDPVFDAEKYHVALKLDKYYWLYNTTNTWMDFPGLAEDQEQIVAIRGENKWCDPNANTDPSLHGAQSVDVVYTGVRNMALPAPGGGYPPLPPVQGVTYTVSSSAIGGMNDQILNVSNDSSGGQAKSEDFWGYLWDQPHFFDRVVYYGGTISATGGWFTSLGVQYTKDGGTTWVNVPAVTIYPPYNFANSSAGRKNFTRYDIFMPTVRGNGVRIYGKPGGTGSFTSIAELEAYGDRTVGPLVVYGVDAAFNERAQGTLDGSHSFSTRGPLSGLQWVQTGGPTVTITGANQATATFTAPGVEADTALTFQFTAGDGVGTASDDVTITVKNLVTTAVAGSDQRVLEGSLVTLNGTGSITTSGSLTYAWTQTGGTTMTLTGPNTATPSFTAPLLWDYNENFIFQLQVSDGVGGVSTDSITVNVKNIIEDGVLIDPLGLSARDISGTEDNPNNVAGASSYDPITQTYTVSGDGEDIWDNDDGFRFVYKEVGSDFSSISVRIDNPPATWPNAWTKIGLMARQDLDADSVFMDLVVSRSNGIVQQYRTTKHGAAARVGGNQPFANGTLNFAGPVWLKLERKVDLWVGYYSFDGTDWVVGSLWNFPTQHTIPIAAPYYVGICVTSHDGGALATARLGELRETTAFVLTDAYAVRNLPASCEVGGTMDVALTLKVNPNNKPTTVTISEQIPAGLSEDDVVAPGATVSAGKILWTLSGTDVKTGTISYSLSIPEETTQALDFAGAVSFGTTTADIIGENLVYPVPTEPTYLMVEMLMASHLSWSAPPQEGVVSYNVFRSVNGGTWELIGSTTATSFVDSTVTTGNNYSYAVSALGVHGVEGPQTSPTAQGSLPGTMVVREAEDFNYGGGQWPWVAGTTVPANEALSATDLGAQYDFWHPHKGGPRDYRPLDAIGIERVLEYGSTTEYHTNIGWIGPSSWWRYTFNVTQPGWIKLTFRLASPLTQASFTAYWDETLIGAPTFAGTGDWHLFTYVPLEQFEETDTGLHTLRVEALGPDPAVDVFNFDKIAIGFNWPAPKRETIWSDNFDTYSTDADVKAGGWTIENGSGYPDAAWRLFDTDGSMGQLGNQDPNLPGMYDKYMVTDSDLAPDATLDERLVSKEVDCTNYLKVRLNYSKNYSRYFEDPDHLQVAEVDIRVFDNGVWGNWVNLSHWDRDTGSSSTPEQLDIASLADKKKIQVRWHFYQAKWDYWFAMDQVRVSGEPLPIQAGKITKVTLSVGQVSLTWTVFGNKQYTVQQTDNLVGATWTSAPGTWPISAQTWTSGDVSGNKKLFYRVMGQ